MHGHDINGFAAVYVVSHDVAVGAEPERGFRCDEVGWGVEWDNRAIAHMTCKFGIVVAEQGMANNRSHAVGTDNQIGFKAAAVVKMRHRFVAGLRNTGTTN